MLNNISVYNFQLGLGTRLARSIAARGWDIDLVCPVPDGSRPAAIQISAEMGLPYREGLVKNRYVGRTFIMPDQRMREVRVEGVVREGVGIVVRGSGARGVVCVCVLEWGWGGGAFSVILEDANKMYKRTYMYRRKQKETIEGNNRRKHNIIQ